MESGIGTLVGALAGVNMISGSGMLDFLVCQSLEKLILDAEAINMAKRMTSGIQKHTETLGSEFFRVINFKGEFLMQKRNSPIISGGTFTSIKCDRSKVNSGVAARR